MRSYTTPVISKGHGRIRGKGGAVRILYLPDSPCQPKRYSRANCSSKGAPHYHCLAKALAGGWSENSMTLTQMPRQPLMKPTTEDSQLSTPPTAGLLILFEGDLGVHLTQQRNILGDFYSFQITNFSLTLYILMFSLSLLSFLLIFPLYNHFHLITKIPCFLFYAVSWFCFM